MTLNGRGLGRQDATRAAIATVCLLLLLLGGLFAGCGDSGNSGAGDLARQQELAEARKEAAQDARQSATIERLEQRLDRIKDGEDEPVSESTVPTTAPAPPSSPPSEETSSPSLGDWPGGSGYSAMLGAFSSEDNARTRQSEASELGLDAGVLYSSNFSSLRPGYWVVFSGTFGTQGEAEARAARARELGYSDSYPRFVAP
jgi:hypothetical protein